MASRRRRSISAVLVAIISLSVAAGCSSSTDAANVEDPSNTSLGRIKQTTTTRPEPPRITISFVGDINFESPRAVLLQNNPETVLSPIEDLLSKADLTVANLESAITDRGTPAPKAYTFRTTPDALVALEASGIDLASVANNHGLDFGQVGVEDALAASEAKNFPIIGIGINEAQAMKPYRKTIRGHRVAVIGATQVLDDSLIPEWTATPTHPGLASAKRVDSLVAAVEAARPTTDTLVVFLHWGIERNDCPSDVQKSLATQLVDAGADVVVGGHAHRLQGGGHLNGAIVHYGLGNFAFYAANETAAATGVFTVQVGGGKPSTYKWHPARIGENGIPSPLTGDVADSALKQWNALRRCTNLKP